MGYYKCKKIVTDYGIVAIHGDFKSRLSYAMHGGETWRNLDDGTNKSYCDIVCCDHLVYALSETCSLEVWDITANTPTKKTILPPCFPQESLTFLNSHKDLYHGQLYLIESGGEFFLVIRYIGYHVRFDGLVVDEGDMLDKEHEGFGFRYETKFFHVFKADLIKKEWVKVENLGAGIIFLGGKQSFLVQAEYNKQFEKNCIYFTHDWEFMNLDEEYYDYDKGMYNLEKRSITSFL